MEHLRSILPLRMTRLQAPLYQRCHELPASQSYGDVPQ